MSEVYVLVKQVSGRPNGEVTLHGVTEDDIVQETWVAAGEDNISFYASTGQAPQFAPFEWEDATDE